jgi:alpha-amylase
MKKPNLKIAALATLAMCFYACNSTDELQGPTAETRL